MVDSITITGEAYEVDELTRKYVTKKIGRLSRYLPRHARKSISADVNLRQIDQGHGNKYEVKITLNIPEKQLTARDSTMNMLAAVDIVEAKIVDQLHEYKATIPQVRRGGVLRRFK